MDGSFVPFHFKTNSKDTQIAREDHRILYLCSHEAISVSGVRLVNIWSIQGSQFLGKQFIL